MCARQNSFARSSLLAHRAALMRSNLSPPEAALWSAINAKKLGTTFRRQVVVGGKFVADFLAPPARLIVEVDGAVVHRGRRSADRRRDEKLRRLGYRTLRIDAGLVLRDLPAAVELVRAALCGPP